MYWSLQMACLLYRVNFLSLCRRRDDIFRWAEFLVHFFRASIKKVGSRDLYRTDSPVMYLHNHRCWADFFLDHYTTEGRAASLSRWAVLPVFPMFLMSAILLKSIKLFKRNRVRDLEAFNSWLDAAISSSPMKGLIVYPEGHRNQKPESLPLKRGILKYAYSRKMPAQIIITNGKEQLMSEKKLTVGFNAQLVCGYSEVITTADYADFESFLAKVQETWDSTWREVYATDPRTMPVLLPGNDADVGNAFSMATVLCQNIICCITTALLLFVVYFAVKMMISSVAALTTSSILLAVVLFSLQMAVLPQPSHSKDE
jgi:hypothetical protein